MAAGGGLFCTVHRPRRYQERTVLGDMAETEIVERYRLSGERINWLVEEFRGHLERDTARSCPLAAETQVNIVTIKTVSLSCWLRSLSAQSPKKWQGRAKYLFRLPVKGS